MPYEVVKRIRGRRYRYRVESYRDAQTGKVRGRWTYLGPAEDEGAAVREPDAGAPAREEPGRERADRRRLGSNAGARRRTETRERLLAALERLLEEREYAAVTAGAVSTEAGLAHGTFYRYFTDKRDALRAAMSGIGETVERAASTLEGPIGVEPDERARLRAWAEAVLSAPIARPGVLRAWYALSANDERVAERRRERRAEVVDALARYLVRLNEHGVARIADPPALAFAVLLMLEGAFRSIVVEQAPLDARRVAGLLAVLDRAVFCDEA